MTEFNNLNKSSKNNNYSQKMNFQQMVKSISNNIKNIFKNK